MPIFDSDPYAAPFNGGMTGAARQSPAKKPKYQPDPARMQQDQVKAPTDAWSSLGGIKGIAKTTWDQYAPAIAKGAGVAADPMVYFATHSPAPSRLWSGQPTKQESLPAPEFHQPPSNYPQMPQQQPQQPQGGVPSWYHEGMNYQLPQGYMDTRSAGVKAGDISHARAGDRNPADYSWGSQIQPVPQQAPMHQAQQQPQGFAHMATQQAPRPSFTEAPPDASNPRALANYILRHNSAVDQHDQIMAGYDQFAQQEMQRYLPIAHDMSMAQGLQQLQAGAENNRYTPMSHDLNIQSQLDEMSNRPAMRRLATMKSLYESGIQPETYDPQTHAMVPNPIWSQLMSEAGFAPNQPMPASTGQAPQQPEGTGQEASFMRTLAHEGGPAAAAGLASVGVTAIPVVGESGIAQIAAGSGAYYGANKLINAMDPEYQNMQPNPWAYYGGNLGGFIAGRKGGGKLKEKFGRSPKKVEQQPTDESQGVQPTAQPQGPQMPAQNPQGFGATGGGMWNPQGQPAQYTGAMRPNPNQMGMVPQGYQQPTVEVSPPQQQMGFGRQVRGLLPAPQPPQVDPVVERLRQRYMYAPAQ